LFTNTGNEMKHCNLAVATKYRNKIKSEPWNIPMSSNGTVLEITERQSGPETPPRIPTALPSKRESYLLL
jgi:hypothetical protein